MTYQLKHLFAKQRIGIFFNDQVIDIEETYKEMEKNQKAENIGFDIPSYPNDFYALGQAGLHYAKKVLEYAQTKSPAFTFSREEVILGPPVPNPSKIICVGINYADHVAEMGAELPEYPVLFSKFRNALIGPEDDIYKSSETNKLDYEVELAVVIGEKASKVPQELAMDYIAGYTIGNDTSARDLQKRTVQWLQGKSLDHTTPIGPWLVTADELTDPSQLKIQSYVNGELRQSSNTKHLIFNIPHLISFISNLMTLEPGDIILTGTPDGVGMAMDPPQFLQDGDKVTMEIEQIGKLENNVRSQN
ncbi:fumarylacetoacetate hydrolase family protein [Gracilibacillus sp. YIM 98692]|uniref:fumarylacetoacetate hydrolase family protein n=1 Tax=Gracilibacillus sp. YIM 98692 TaxID=2663532 RepID=UPI003204D466